MGRQRHGATTVLGATKGSRHHRPEVTRPMARSLRRNQPCGPRPKSERTRARGAGRARGQGAPLKNRLRFGRTHKMVMADEEIS